MFKEISGLLTAFGASGLATILTTFLTGKKSGVKQQVIAEQHVDSVRQHLQDEVLWLRHQLAAQKEKGSDG